MKSKCLFLIPLFCIALVNTSFSQDDEDRSDPVVYSEVVQVEGVSANDLFSRASEWFAKTYKSSNAVLQMNDRAAGKLVGKGAQSATVKSLGSYREAGYFEYTDYSGL